MVPTDDSPAADALDERWLAAWRGLLAAHAQVIRGLENDMMEQHGLPLTWFDALSRIRQSPEKRLRLRELERASLFTRSGMTRLADRLEDAGLIRRERDPSDRRGVFLAITEEGESRIDEAWPDHQESIRHWYARHLDEEDAEALIRATSKILGADARRVLAG